MPGRKTASVTRWTLRKRLVLDQPARGGSTGPFSRITTKLDIHAGLVRHAARNPFIRP